MYEVAFLVDTSGSMYGYTLPIERHINSLIKACKSGEIPVRVHLATFNSQYNGLVKDTKSVSLYANGGTDLYGSCYDLLEELTTDTSRSEDSKIMIIVISDGQDGMRRLNPTDIKNEVTLVEENLGWDFLFVGTNMNAYQVGESMGVKPGKALSFANTEQGFEKMLQSLQNIIRQWSAGQIAHDSEFFTSEIISEQEALMS